MFTLKQKVVYPGHGVAEINNIIEKKVNNTVAVYYELTFLSKKATILIPVANINTVGIRPLSNTDTVNEVLLSITRPAKRITMKEFLATTWNRRNKSYQLKLATGDLTALSDIYKDLRFLSQTKELSFGEKTILQQVEFFLSEEIALVRSIGEEDAKKILFDYSTYTADTLNQTLP